MKAVLVREFGGPERLRVEQVDDLRPGPDQVLVKVHAAGVNPVDTYIRAGAHSVRPALPYTPGFDGAGGLRAAFVEALGERHPARSIAYPNRTLDTLQGYARFAAGTVGVESRPVLIAESFSGLVAAKSRSSW